MSSIIAERVLVDRDSVLGLIRSHLWAIDLSVHGFVVDWWHPARVARQATVRGLSALRVELVTKITAHTLRLRRGNVRFAVLCSLVLLSKELRSRTDKAMAVATSILEVPERRGEGLLRRSDTILLRGRTT